MPYYYYGFDWTYLVLILPCIIFSMIASSRVNSTFKKYSAQYSQRRLTGAEAARRVLQHNGVSGVRIERVSGNLTDHYDPRTNVIRLSDSVYNSTSVAAIGVAAHECGHAIQHAHGYAALKLRSASVPVANIGSKLSWPLILLGLALGYAELARVGVFLFTFVVLFQLITLPVEFNASRRALEGIRDMGILYDDELDGAKQVLTAAAMTYVAALASSLLSLLRLLVIANNRRN